MYLREIIVDNNNLLLVVRCKGLWEEFFLKKTSEKGRGGKKLLCLWEAEILFKNACQRLRARFA